MSAVNVRLYGTRFCPYCIAARNLFSNEGIAFDNIEVDNNPRLRRQIMEKSGRRTVPQIWIGERHIGGFDDLKRAFKSGQLGKLLDGREATA